MNPSTVMKISSKVDVAKITYTVGGVMLLIIMFLYIKKKIKESKEEDKNKEYLKQIDASINTSNLSFSNVDYQTMADSLYSYLSDTRAGYAGVDEDGVYSIMERLKTYDDVQKLIKVFDSREIRKRWQTKSHVYTLPGAIAALMSQSERDEINEHFEKNGISFRF
ncbi:MAG: hypothetical protein IIV21_05190 [Bacteroidales bacterium]|nr:hypothetical protein [Bacteroidales bacterium]MBR0323131.1 hypothetical protein [Bacteroidales bacterium]